MRKVCTQRPVNLNVLATGCESLRLLFLLLLSFVVVVYFVLFCFWFVWFGLCFSVCVKVLVPHNCEERCLEYVIASVLQIG